MNWHWLHDNCFTSLNPSGVVEVGQPHPETHISGGQSSWLSNQALGFGTVVSLPHPLHLRGDGVDVIFENDDLNRFGVSRTLHFKETSLWV